MDKARVIAYKVLTQIDSEEVYSNLSLNREINRANLEFRDRRLATELVYGVLRMRGHLDYIINQFSKHPVKNLDPGVRNLLRLGVYQIKFLDKIPVRAAVHTTVELAKRDFHMGIAKFINGVLRNIDRKIDQVSFPDQIKDPVGYISTFYSHPEWLVKKWVKRYGVKETIELCKANNRVPELTIRANTLKIDPATLANNLAEKYGYEVSLLPYPAEGILLENATGFTQLKEFYEGEFTVQGQASMLVAHALQLKPGMKVADLCAAPGGKTTHMAALMRNEGEILAIDIYSHKIDLIEANCKRLGVTNVKTLCADTTTLELKEEQFDRILLDAPCSGLGLLAQKPEIRWMKTEKEIKELARLQKILLKKGLSWLKPGGIMVYSTCTITEEENQKVLEEALKMDSVELIDLRYLLPEEEKELFSTPYLEFLPHVTETEGFFIAAIRKLN
ncbi:16S rRNA (cytosine(967)-C(5))-methyltransferase [Anoxybacter fermentans]|uniref:16S rRNA (cytosine(967)-C(5))-methyltransferase n=1 Tax=Anoxybacter fermentans TaxID=1323375 RepID=A0A3Q9HQ65_9FIRM|nr:16S rRNA (cytosine(967)-C(5))-methyltransferase RsmB [Anoxybacter fermentans]AZR72962.1 16S rRNA (cytosine(967)-C(5))-methyltransferase [Anoxybacter fermentans]